jgi:hypothetical protein
MNRPKIPFWAAILSLLAATSCVVTLPAPGVVPTPAAPATGMVVPTQAVAPTIASLATNTPLPTPTATETPTLFPTITPFPTETPIPSETPTSSITNTPDTGVTSADLTQTASEPEVSGNPIGSEYACMFIDKSPDNWTVMKPRKDFDAVWQLRNAGTKSWQIGGVKLVFIEGTRMNGARVIDLASDIKPNKNGKVAVDLQAPKEEGKYVSVWGLRNMRTNQLFCIFSIKIVVKK